MVAGSYGGSRLAKPRPARGGVAEDVAAHRVLHAAPAEPRLTPEDREDDGFAGGTGTGERATTVEDWGVTARIEPRRGPT
jgi:hypothetical protein